MRITTSMIFNNIASSLQKNLEEYAHLNERLATGKKINKISDNITGSVNALGYRLNISINEQYKRNIDKINIQLDYTTKIMESVSDSLVKLHELAAMGNNGQSEDKRIFYSKQAADWRDYFLSLSNSKLDGRFIFSGNKTDKQTFVYNSVTGKYDYRGDNGEVMVPVDKEASVAMNIQGGSAFSLTLSEPLPSALSDGTPINFIQSKDPLTGINTITVEIGNSGDPDYDTFTFSNFMDIANIMTYAWQFNDVNGSSLSSDPEISEKMALHRIAALIKPIDDARVQTLGIQSEIGSRQIVLNDQSRRISASMLVMQNTLTKIEGADITETATELLKAQTALEALRASASKILSQSLLDFLK